MNMQSPVQHALRTAAILTVFAIVGTLVLAAVYLATRSTIAETERQAKLALIGQILPQELYDNDIIRQAASLPPAPELGNAEPSTVYRAFLHGAPSAAVLEVVAPDGYDGRIKMVVAVRADGRVVGVRVVDHHETPGLGDYIDIAKSPWIKVFDGKSLADPAPRLWKVKKDGGAFEHNTGATVTPRAVIKAVAKSLGYFARNKDTIFALPVSNTATN